jgi:hypothetical protein
MKIWPKVKAQYKSQSLKKDSGFEYSLSIILEHPPLHLQS